MITILFEDAFHLLILINAQIKIIILIKSKTLQLLL